MYNIIFAIIIIKRVWNVKEISKIIISAVLFIIIIVLSQMLNKYEPFTDTNKGEIDDSPRQSSRNKKTLDFKQIVVINTAWEPKPIGEYYP